jgi:hypothetical protein
LKENPMLPKSHIPNRLAQIATLMHTTWGERSFQEPAHGREGMTKALCAGPDFVKSTGKVDDAHAPPATYKTVLR